MQSIVKSRGAAFDVDAITVVAHREFHAAPRTFNEVRAVLMAQFADCGYAVSEAEDAATATASFTVGLLNRPTR